MSDPLPPLPYTETRVDELPRPRRPYRSPFAVCAAVLLAGGGLWVVTRDAPQEPEPPPQPASGRLTADLAYEPPAEREAGPPPTVDAITVRFDQATFTTTYEVVVAGDTEGRATIDWRLEPVEDCGVFTHDGTSATWTHPHEDQRGQPSLAGFPPDRFCEVPALGGHPGRVVVVVRSGGQRCEAAYEGGSSAGRVERPATTCARP